MAFVPTLDLHEHTLPRLLRRNAERLPDNDCIVAPEFGVCWSWKEFDRRTSEVARGMYAMGIRKGDHVAIWSTNTPEWMLTMFASAKLGAILVTVNTNYKQFELNYLLNQSDTKMLVMTAGVKNNDYISHITGLVPALTTEQPDNISCKQLPFLKRVLLIGDSERRPMGMSRFDDLYEAAKSVPESVVEESIAGLDTHETINMQYTSGTTGFPKGVMLTHYNITNNGQFLGDCMKLTEEDRLLIVVPLFHCFGCVLGVMSCLTHCTTIVLMDHYNPLREMQILQDQRCTAVHGVPTMFIGMLEHPEFDRFDFSRLRTGIMAGAGYDAAIMEGAEPSKRLLGPMAYFTAAFANFAPQFSRITLTIDGKTVETQGVGVLAINFSKLQFDISLVHENLPRDGMFDIVVMNTHDAVGLIPAILSCMLDRAGEFPARPDVMEVFRCRECTVVADPPLDVQYDGEVTGTTTPFTVRMLPEAARFVVSEECLKLFGEESASPLNLD